MNLLKIIWEYFFQGGDEAYDTTYKMGYRGSQGHVEKVSQWGFIWVTTKPERQAGK